MMAVSKPVEMREWTNIDIVYPKDVLAQAEYHSVDPYMRPYMEQYPLGVTMIGGQVCKYLFAARSNFS